MESEIKLVTILDTEETAEPFAEVHLIGKEHEIYCGPVHRWAGRLWISYKNEPLEVAWLHGNQYEERN